MKAHVVDVDRINGDVIVTFDDGLTVRYPAELLREMVPQAQVAPEPDEEPQD